MLIVLEGIDGSGTTTQARILADFLHARGRAVHLTRQPSDGPIGRSIRDILQGSRELCSPETMALLFAADRADHLRREVDPALERGQIVISDRWYHSSYAYQTLDLPDEWVRSLSSRCRVPDLTIFLRVPPDVAHARILISGRRQERYEDLETMTRVAYHYELLAEFLGPGERMVTVDGEQSDDDVALSIRAVVGDRAPGVLW